MKKVILILAVIAFVAVATASHCFALKEEKTFTLSASIPLAQSISINPYSVDTATGVETPVTGTALGFDPMTFDPENEIWTPDHYFFVDVVTAGGAGTPTTTLTFTQGQNPNGAMGNGLGHKGNVSYTKVVDGIPVEIPTHPKELFKDVSADTILPSELTGGYFRAYLGINTGDSGTPTGGEVFSNGDAAGTYDGTLLISATL